MWTPAPQPPIRILSSEAARTPHAEPAIGAPARVSGAPTPRIGAPGGSGSGARRVVPAQSGNETVGGLPPGAGNGNGNAGRG